MVDGLFIRSLVLTFFIKHMPDLILEGHVFIAEPPLYRVDDKKNPFVINMVDYNDRYVKSVMKDYRIGYVKDDKSLDVDYLDKDTLMKFLNDSKHFEDDIHLLSTHYRYRDRNSNERLIEMILEEFVYAGFDKKTPYSILLERINVQKMINRISATYKEIYFDDATRSVNGIIDTQPQHIELSTDFVHDSKEVLEVLKEWAPPINGSLLLKENRTGIEHKVSILEALKILSKYKPHILHRFKGLNARPYNLNCREVLVS